MSAHATVQHVCSMCHFQSIEFRRFKSHVVRMHRNNPDFIISCSYRGCAYSTKSWNAFKMHVSRYHSEVIQNFDDDVQLTAEFASDDLLDSESFEVGDVSCSSSNVHNITEFKNSEFALKLETQHKIPQVSIDAIVQHTSHLISHHVSEVVNSIKSYLQPKISAKDSLFINNFIKGVKLSNIKSEYNRKKYYSNHCHLVEPEEVLLGTEFIKFKGHVKEVKRCGYYIPLQKNSTGFA